MAISDIDRSAVLSAIEEYDRLGEALFLSTYGFRQSRSYWLLYEGQRYASKALLGVAHRFAMPSLGILAASAFSGGESTAQRKFEELGFTVETQPEVPKTSDRLEAGKVYTRVDLRGLFGIGDATLNNGIFRPKGMDSIWLFITEEKTSDRTHYRDRLMGDTLFTQGQTAGRTDHLILEHEKQGLELLVFFRRSRHEHPGAGFRYLGPFCYVEHTGSHPTDFVLRNVQPPVLLGTQADELPFNPASVKDARQRVMRVIAERRGQRVFRDRLRRAYDGKCALTGCGVLDVLEAAHITPYLGEETNKISNGLLLRADVHTLFDCGLITIDPNSYLIQIAQSLQLSEYAVLHGKPIRIPGDEGDRPSRIALEDHFRFAELATRISTR